MLQIGCSGPEVATLQQFLNEQAGCTYGIMVDGIFGQATETAVRNFQTNMGLVADGIVGPATYGIMGSLGFAQC